MDIQKKKNLTAGLLVFASILWGGSFAAQSAAAQLVGPHTFNSLRLLAGGLALIPVVALAEYAAKKRGRREPFLPRLKASVLGGTVCGLMLLGATFTQQAAMETVSAGKAGFLTALYIVLVPVFGSFFGRRPEKKIWFCVFLDMVGFYFLCVHGTFTVAKEDLLLLVTASFFALQILAVEWAIRRGADGFMLACAEFLTGGLLELPFMLIGETPVLAGIVPALPQILYVGAISGAIGYSLQNIGQKYIDSAPAALLMSPESVFSALFGWMFLGQKLSGTELLGCACVFAAVILSQVKGRRGSRQ